MGAPLLQRGVQAARGFFGRQGVKTAKRFASAIGENSAKSVERLGMNARLLVAAVRQTDLNVRLRQGTLTPLLKKTEELMKNPQLAHEYHQQLLVGIKSSDSFVDETSRNFVKLRDDVYTEAKQHGIAGPPVGDNWPRMISEFESRRLNPRRVPHNPNVTPQGTVHTLESPRKYNKSNFRTDPAVPLEHLNDSYRRLEYAKTFGAYDENLNLILKAIAKESGLDAALYSRRWYETVAGRLQKGLDPAEQFMAAFEGPVTSFQVATKLSLAVISNTGQSAFVLAEVGLRPFFRSLAKTIKNYGDVQEFGLRTGATMQQALRDLRIEVGAELATIGGKVLKRTGFSWVETFNRNFASYAGKEMAQDAFAKLQRNPTHRESNRMLRSFGIDPAKVLVKGSLSERDLLTAGKRLNELTQDFGNPMAVPLLWRTSPTGRMLTLFRQFGFGASRWMKDRVIKPAFEYGVSGGKRGSVLPLLRVAATFPILGEVLGDVKALVRHGTLANRPTDIVGRIADDFAQVGAFAIMEDLHFLLTSSHQSIVDYIGGPIGQDINRFGRAAFSDDKILNLVREATKTFPVVGPITASTFYGDRRRKRAGRQQRKRTK